MEKVDLILLLVRMRPHISESLANSSTFLNSGGKKKKKAIGNSGENGATRFSFLWRATAFLFVENQGYDWILRMGN